MQMELKESLQQTLSQIMDGISAAQEHAAQVRTIVNPPRVPSARAQRQA